MLRTATIFGIHALKYHLECPYHASAMWNISYLNNEALRATIVSTAASHIEIIIHQVVPMTTQLPCENRGRD